jgi:glycosyltransferase involved in cell wall biosynthesis
MPEIAPITVVLISRNRAAQLRRVIPAIAEGTLRPVEVLLADDASDDDTVEVFETFCRKCGLQGRVLRHEPGITAFRISSMRNAGLRASQTERVILLDADHVPSMTHIASHMRMLDRGRTTLSYGPRLEFANEDGSGPVNFMWGHEPYGSMSPSADEPLPFWELVAGSNLGMHRLFAREIGDYDTDYDGGYGYEDADFNCRAAGRGAKFYGEFGAYVIHLPHQTATGARQGSRNAELFKRKNGTELHYPPIVPWVTHGANWAERYALFREHRTALPLRAEGTPPEPGEPSKAMTRWAATHVGGRFLLRLALAKFLGRFGGRGS